MLVCCHIVGQFVASLLVIDSTLASRVGVYNFIADKNCHFCFGILGHEMDLEDCLSHNAVPNTVLQCYDYNDWYIVCGISLHLPFCFNQTHTHISVM